MAIIEYKLGEHQSGFVGFRVARTIGDQADYRQEYFALSEYSRADARRFAKELDHEWQLEAKEVLKSKKKNIYTDSLKYKKNVFAIGLRASIEVEHKFRGGEDRAYFAPCFLVKKPGIGKSCITYRIRKLGFECAYIEAVTKYCELHDLSDEDEAVLLSRQPDRTLFTNTLLKELRTRGYKLSKKALEEMMSVADLYTHSV